VERSVSGEGLVDIVAVHARSDMLERRRPVMQAWQACMDGEAEAKVVAFNGRRERS